MLWYCLFRLTYSPELFDLDCWSRSDLVENVNSYKQKKNCFNINVCTWKNKNKNK